MNPFGPHGLCRICRALVWCCLQTGTVCAQVSARSMALGEVVSVLDDPATATCGMAGLARQEQRAAGVVYLDGFGVKELAEKRVFAVVPMASDGGRTRWTGAATVQHFGFALYHETAMALRMGGFLHPNVPAGIGCDMAHAGTADGRSTWHLTGGLGIRWLMSENLSAGMTVNHLTAAGRTLLPESYRHAVWHLGCSWRLSSQALVVSEWQWHGGQAFADTWHAGFEFQPAGALLLRCGWHSGPPSSCSLGLGWHGRRWRIDLAAATHPYLGRNLSFSLWKPWP